MTQSESTRFEFINTILVSGRSNSGKTTFSYCLTDHLHNAVLLETDELFMHPEFLNDSNREFINEAGLINIARYIHSPKFDILKFTNILMREIKQRLSSSEIDIYTLIIEGYVIDLYKEQIISSLNRMQIDKTIFCQMRIVQQRYMLDIDGRQFDVTGKEYNAAFQHIDDLVRKLEIRRIGMLSNYQTFDMFNNCKGSSDSRVKFNRSRIKRHLKQTDNVLDIGCNYGYFCFKAAEITSGKIHGIDKSKTAIFHAERNNATLFGCGNIEFMHRDVLDYRSTIRYDLVLCFSTFHYFRENQRMFLEKIKSDLISENGIFILEVELSNKAGILVEKISRRVDDRPCFFPTLGYFEKLISGLFSNEEKYPSVRQKGSKYDRHFFSMRPLFRGH